MATKTMKATIPLIDAARPVTRMLAAQIAHDASTPQAPLPLPVIWPIFLSLIQAIFPCLVTPTPAKVQAVLSNPTRFQARRMDNEIYRSWRQHGSPGSYFAFSHAVFAVCRKADVHTVAALMAENPRA